MQKVNYDILISIASWEERFFLGYEKNLDKYSFKSCLIIKNPENPHIKSTEENLSRILITQIPAVSIEEVNFSSPIETWRGIENLFSKHDIRSRRVLFDITTSPREVIWYILHFLLRAQCIVDYIYYRPDQYHNEWLTKDTRKPRFLIKHSGISEFEKPTCLFVLTGFDPNRTEQLISFYEPKFILLGIQKSNPLDEKRNKDLHKSLISQYKNNIKTFTIDSYKERAAFNTIVTNIEEYIGDYNLIMSSLGPKISAVTIYKIFLKYNRIALTYAKSNEYNIGYSNGIGEPIKGSIKRSAVQSEL